MNVLGKRRNLSRKTPSRATLHRPFMAIGSSHTLSRVPRPPSPPCIHPKAVSFGVHASLFASFNFAAGAVHALAPTYVVLHNVLCDCDVLCELKSCVVHRFVLFAPGFTHECPCTLQDRQSHSLAPMIASLTQIIRSNEWLFQPKDESPN